MTQKYEHNLEGFNRERYKLAGEQKVYDAELFGITMAIRHIMQRFGRDTQKIPVLTDSKAALSCIKNGKEDPGQGFTRNVYRWERDLLKKHPSIQIGGTWERSSRPLDNTESYGASR
jgi:hypothetical protein